MKRIPIEHKGRIRVIEGQDRDYAYAIPEINENIKDPAENVGRYTLSGQENQEIFKLFSSEDSIDQDFNDEYDIFKEEDNDILYISPKRLGLNAQNKLKIVTDGESDKLYIINETDSGLSGNKFIYNYKEYLICYSCESIRQQMENNYPLQPFAVQGWDYVRVTEDLNYQYFAPEKISFLSKLGFDELQGGLWCRECGSTVLAKTYFKEHEDVVEISFSFNKDEDQVDKITFKLPASVSILPNTNFSSIGTLVTYNDTVISDEFVINSIGSSDYTILKNGEMFGTLKLNPNRNQISLMMNRNGQSYSDNITYSLFVNKIWFTNLSNIDIYDVMQVGTFNVSGDKDIYLQRYVGYVKVDSYSEIHDPSDDWDPSWPVSEQNGGNEGPDPVNTGIRNTLAWGVNNFGQLGDGTIIDRVVKFSTPNTVSVPAEPILNLLTDAKMIKSGKDHALAIKEDTTVWSWGRNNIGQLGLTQRDESAHSFPSKVGELSNIVDVAGGWFHSVALEGDGTVWTWGGNYKGQLGDGTNTPKSRPIQVKVQGTGFLTGIRAVAAGSEHTIALDNSGKVWEWGEDQFYPKLVENLSEIVAIATGSFHSIALKSDGTVWAWGYNWSGQLGIGFEDYPDSMNEKDEYVKAVQVLGLTNIVAIDCGAEHSLALKDDGSLWSWGLNNLGQLGLGTVNMNKYYPVRVSSLSGVKIISAGEYHNFISLEDKTVWAWGNNDKGQLCLNNFNSQPSPVQVSVIPEVSYLNCGNYHNFAIKVVPPKST